MAARTITPQPEVLPYPQVKLRLETPEHVFARYEALARETGMEVETYISEHLRQTVEHDHSAASLYFSPELSARLCALTGRGRQNDAAKVVQRLEALATIKLGDIVVQLDASIFDRLAHNSRIQKGITTVADFITREATNGIRVALGLSPK